MSNLSLSRVAVGAVECSIAIWVISGRHARTAALAETALLVIMNAGGVLWAGRIISDPAGMLFQNSAFLVLAWIAASPTPCKTREFQPYAART